MPLLQRGTQSEYGAAVVDARTALARRYAGPQCGWAMAILVSHSVADGDPGGINVVVDCEAACR